MRHNKFSKAFTLIEIMVVVLILGILASIIVPKLADRPNQARLVKAQQDIMALENALALYKMDNGFYPSTDQGLTALIKRPNTSPLPTRWKQYINKLPNDPWGKPYQYLNPGTHQEIDIFTQREQSDEIIGNWNET